jgi:hypothetical protein
LLQCHFAKKIATKQALWYDVCRGSDNKLALVLGVLDQSNQHMWKGDIILAWIHFCVASLFNHKPKKLCGHTKKCRHFISELSKAIDRYKNNAHHIVVWRSSTGTCWISLFNTRVMPDQSNPRKILMAARQWMVALVVWCGNWIAHV